MNQRYLITETSGILMIGLVRYISMVEVPQMKWHLKENHNKRILISGEFTHINLYKLEETYFFTFDILFLVDTADIHIGTWAFYYLEQNSLVLKFKLQSLSFWFKLFLGEAQSVALV